MKDTFNRKIDYLRISVTDRCNLRCIYCMPKDGVKCLAHGDIMTYEEILRVAECFARLGVSQIKITGGEPLVRLDVVNLIQKLKHIKGIESVTLTTNGIQLVDFIDKLNMLKIDGINISIDTLKPELYKKITGSNALHKVTEGFSKALEYPNINIKINCVSLGIPEQDFVEVAGLAQNNPVHVRFIEMMPIGMGRNFSYKSEKEIMHELEQAYGTLEPYNEKLGNGPCRYYSLNGFLGKIGFISAMSHKFCTSCNRVRLTADGKLKTCLQYDVGVNLKELLRSGKTDQELRTAVLNALEHKPKEHRFAENVFADVETKAMFQIGG